MTIAIYRRSTWRATDQAPVQMSDGFVGFVQRRRKRFEAVASSGARLGSFRTAAAAERALDRSADGGRSARGVVTAGALLIAGILGASGTAVIALVTL